MVTNLFDGKVSRLNGNEIVQHERLNFALESALISSCRTTKIFL